MSLGVSVENGTGGQRLRDRLGGGYSRARGETLLNLGLYSVDQVGRVLRALPAKTHKPWLQNTLVKCHS